MPKRRSFGKTYSKSKISRTGPSSESYKVTARAKTLSSKNLGLSRVWNLVAPPFKVKQHYYAPRIGNFSAAAGSSQINGFGDVVELPVIEATPGTQSMHQIPHMSCFEYQVLANKCLDNMTLGGTGISQPSSLTKQEIYPSKMLMVEKCKYKYYFENCQTWDAFVEITEIQPRKPIVDQMIVTGSPMGITSISYQTPLDMMFRDFRDSKSGSNIHYPIDASYSDSKAQAQQRIGYNTRGAAFYKNYRVLRSKVFKLGPGSKITYDLAIPGFKARSDFNLDSVVIVNSLANPASTPTFITQPSMWEKSRWLLIRTWSGYVSNTADTSRLGIGDTKIKIMCSRDLSMRPIPQVKLSELYVNSPNGIDAFGPRQGAQGIVGVSDVNVRVIDEADDEIVAGASI